MNPKPTIAIDGPASSGKGTVAKMLAQRLGLQYLDTGAMYRAVALMFHRRGFGAERAGDSLMLTAEAKIEFPAGDPSRILLDGEDVSAAIRAPEIGDLASELSAYGPLRELLVADQQKIVLNGGYVLEGRDTTTVIAPDATLKIYLTASLEERARRRFKELEEKGMALPFDEVMEQMRERDERDTTRAHSPLTIAPDAHVINSDFQTPEQVVQRIIELLEDAVSKSGGTHP